MSTQTQSRRLRELKAKGRKRCESWIKVGSGLMSPEPPVYVSGKDNKDRLLKWKASRKAQLKKQNYEYVVCTARSDGDDHLHSWGVKYYFSQPEIDQDFHCSICGLTGPQ